MSFHVECAHCGTALLVEGEAPDRCDCGGKLIRVDNLAKCASPQEQGAHFIGDGNFRAYSSDNT